MSIINDVKGCLSRVTDPEGKVVPLFVGVKYPEGKAIEEKRNHTSCKCWPTWNF